MRIAHVTPSVNLAGGGLATAALGLAEAQALSGHDITVHASGCADPDRARFPSGVQLRPFHAVGSARFAYAPYLVADLIAARPQVIHSHGIWTYVSFAAAAAARVLDVPHICAPHGMLDAWALARSPRRKALIGSLFQWRVLRGASCLHALVSDERDQMRALGLRAPVALVPNGVSSQLLNSPRTRAAFDRRYPHLRGRRIILFLSRVHPKKGLPNLITAWASLTRSHPQWHLVIAGPDELGHAEEVKRMVRRLGLESTISVIGPQVGDEVVECLSAADLFVLPSYSEGFSFAVLEALACGTPVCITTACNLPEVQDYECGRVCTPDIPALSHALDLLMSRTPDQREAMGEAGRRLVGGAFTWKRSGDALAEIYSWLISHEQGAARPVALGPG